MAKLARFFHVNLLATLRANLRAKTLSSPSILLLGHTSLTLGKSSKIVAAQGSRLTFNQWWYGHNRESAYLCVHDGGTLKLSGLTTFYRACDVSVADGALLELDYVNINNNAQIHCSKHIKIGRGTLIGEGVRIRDGDDHSVSKNGVSAPTDQPIIIGERVLIAVNVTILPGVTIGDGAVVAAGAVVTRDVPPHTLAGGVPARVIAENVEWGESDRERDV